MAEKKYKYKVAKKADKVTDSIIEKRGVVVQFTLKEVEDAIIHNTTELKKIEENLKILKARKVNVLKDYPEVETMDAKLRIAAFLYEDGEMRMKKIEESMIPFREAIVRDREESQAVLDQCGEELVTKDEPQAPVPAEVASSK